MVVKLKGVEHQLAAGERADLLIRFFALLKPSRRGGIRCGDFLKATNLQFALQPVGARFGSQGIIFHDISFRTLYFVQM